MASWLNLNGSQIATDAATRHRLYDASLEGPHSLPPSSSLVHDASSSSDSSETDIHPPRPRERPQRPGHSRSLSHPFPSLFAGKKKRHQEGSDRDSSESECDAGASPMIKARTKALGRSQRSGHDRQRSHDFVNGNCMTCGCLLRWPRDLPVFRCTVCLTINDVGPRQGGPEERILSRARGHEGAGPLQHPSPTSSKSRMPTPAG
jgi:E3 ubiquitin-protein ligase HECTD2